MNDGLDDLDSDVAVDIIQDEIATYVNTAFRIFEAGLGSLNDEPAQAKAAQQLEHLHLSEPWLPAVRAAERLRAVGLLCARP